MQQKKRNPHSSHRRCASLIRSPWPWFSHQESLFFILRGCTHLIWSPSPWLFTCPPSFFLLPVPSQCLPGYESLLPSPDTTEAWIPPESPIRHGFTSIAPTPFYRFMLVSEAAGLLPELFPTSSVTLRVLRQEVLYSATAGCPHGSAHGSKCRFS